MSQPGLILGPDETGLTVFIEGDRIRETRNSKTAQGAGTSGAQAVDCTGGRIQPGFVNSHTHVYSGLAPFDMPAPAMAPENFVQILERVWWPLDEALDEAALRASAEFYLANALLYGTTSLVDHHESPNFIDGSLDVIADVASQLGIRAVIAYGATERNRGRDEAAEGMRECRRFVRENRRPLVRGMVGVHASFTVSDETLREVGDVCRELDVPLHIHVAEDMADVVDAQARGYLDPWDRLRRLNVAPAGSILAHCVHTSAESVRAIDEAGLWIVQNPRSNRGNGVGYPRSIRESKRVALGTDGYPAYMKEERAVLALDAAEHGERSEAVDGRLDAGRKLMGEIFDADFDLAPGSMADLIVVEGDRVRHVVVGGRLVVAEGKLTSADMEYIRTRAEAEASRLWSRLEQRR